MPHNLDLSVDVSDLLCTLIDIPSESRSEGPIADAVEEALGGVAHLEVVRDGHTIIARTNLGRPHRVVIGGHLDMFYGGVAVGKAAIDGGNVKALAVTSAQRSAALPDVPTIAEAGVKGYESGVWFGLAAPAGTPADIIAKLSAAAIQGTKSPEFVKRMTELGYDIIAGTPEDMAASIKTEIARWTPIVKSSGAKVD